MDIDLNETSSTQEEVSQESKSSIPEIKQLYEGQWADKLVDGQEIQVGRNLYGGRDLNMILDFSSFEGKLSRFSKDTVQQHYENVKETWDNYIKSNNADIDPFLAYQCYVVLHHVNSLLDVANQEKGFENKRNEIVYRTTTPKLSDFTRVSMCVERAALTQYLFQKIEVNSSYVSGVKFFEPELGSDSSYEHHAFVVLNDPRKPGTTLIFDPSDTVNGDKIPAIVRTDKEYTYDLLRGKKNICISGTEVFSKSRSGYGIKYDSELLYGERGRSKREIPSWR